jgi:subtilisin family serine protease
MKARSTYSGRNVRVAVIDSGVNPAHPHLARVAPGIGFLADGTATRDCLDRLGHGTAVAAAIQEKAPDAEVVPVKILHDALDTRAAALARAIDWAAAHEVHAISLSVGLVRADLAEALREPLDRALARGLIVVAARRDGARDWYPGTFAGPLGVLLDWTCPRDEYRIVPEGSRILLAASGYARPIPGVDPERNLKGISFAVANVTGFVARALEACPNASSEQVVEVLTARATECSGVPSRILDRDRPAGVGHRGSESPAAEPSSPLGTLPLRGGLTDPRSPTF